MAGKPGSTWKGRRYRNYYCSRALRSRAFCSTYNQHSVPKLEKAILGYLAQFSDPELVRQHMEAAERKEMEQSEAELKEVQKGLSDLEAQFVRHLDLLKKDILNETEFVKANELIRSQKEALDARRGELQGWVDEQQGKVSASERMPQAIRTFLEDLETMDVRVAKSHLQTILKAAHVKKDEIELEFRG